MTIEQRSGNGEGLEAPARHRPTRAQASEHDSFADFARALSEHRGAVAALALAALAAGAAYLALATPRYQSDLLIQVEAQATGATALSDLTGSAIGPRAPTELEPEMEILRSRSLLGGVVDELGLAIEAAPRRLPVLGRAIARHHVGGSPAPPLLGLARWGWGGEQIGVERLEVGADLLDVPLRLVADEGGRYRLASGDGVLLLEGKVGQPARAEGPARLELLVSELVARPGTEFVLRRRRSADVVVALQARLRVMEKAKKSGVIALALEDPNPERAAAVLNSIAARYVRRGQDRASEEASQALAFLESQLPIRRAKLDKAEAALGAFQRGKRLGNLTFEGQAVLAQGNELDKELRLLEQQRAELRQHYTESHPAVAEVAAKLRTLRSSKAELEERQRQLPKAELEAARLARDLKTATDQYLQLVAEAERLKVAKAGSAANAVVLDSALVPARPVSPRRAPVLALAALLGLASGIGMALARRTASSGNSRVEELERRTGLPVLASLPHSRTQGRLARRARMRAGAAPPVLSAFEPLDAAVDDVWALRGSLELALARRPTGVVAVLGAAPQVGKSFVCANLAYVLAASGRKVLLVDADLRHGTLHRFFGAAHRPGLADVVSGTAALDVALVHVGALDLLPAGAAREQPAGLLAGPAFERLLSQLSRGHEIVIVDTPPVLAVSDAQAVARLADVNLLVLRAGRDSEREAAQAVQRLERSGARVDGLVLNDVQCHGDKYARYRASAPASLRPEEAEDRPSGVLAVPRPSWGRGWRR